MPRRRLGYVTHRVRRLVFERDKLTCQACGIVGRKVKRHSHGHGYYTDIPEVYLSVDHIQHASKGGTSTMENLRTLCTTCNTERSIKEDADWEMGAPRGQRR